MSTQSISLRYRPVRIGFLIEEGKLESMVAACEINTILWGGIYNPIIPVGKDAKKAKGIIDLFNVDVLLPLDQTDIIQQIRDEDKFRDLPMHGNLFYEDWRSKKKQVSVLDVVNLFDFYWEKEFKGREKSFLSNFRILDWEADDPLAPLYTIRYGRFPNKNLLFDYPNFYLKALRGGRESLEKNTPISEKMLKFESPITATRFQLRGYFGDSVRHGVYFGDPASFTDLNQFWNLRAGGTPLEFVPKNQISQYKTYLETFLERENKFPDAHPDIPDMITLFAKEEDTFTKISEVLKDYKGKKTLSFAQFGEESLLEPSIFYFDWHTATASLDKPFEKYQLSVSLPKRNFLVESDRQRRQMIAVNLNPMSEFGYKDHTLRLPNISGLNEFYSRETAFTPWALRVGKDGITFLEESDRDLLQIHPIAFGSIIREVFKHAGFKKIKTSTSGVMSHNVIRQMGELEDCRVFKLDCVRTLLSKPKPMRRGELQSIVKVDKTKYSDLILVEGQERAAPNEDQVISHLLDKKLVTLGFNLPCKNCEHESWFSLKTVDEVWTCQFCDAVNNSIRQIYTQKSTHFRTSGIFTLEKKEQEGSIPVILTLLLLQRALRDHGFIYSTALKLEEGSPNECETDLCVIEQSPRGDAVNIAIGECKDHKEIDDNDVANLKQAREKLVKTGLGCYLIFSKVGSFSDAEIERFKKLKAEKIPIILLTGAELDEALYPYWKNPDPKLPEKSALSLEDLWRNSDYLYLSK